MRDHPLVAKLNCLIVCVNLSLVDNIREQVRIRPLKVGSYQQTGGQYLISETDSTSSELQQLICLILCLLSYN